MKFPVSSPVRLLPPLPRWARFALAGVIVALLVYGMASVEGAPSTSTPEPLPSAVVVTPELDTQLLATARDGSREERLVLEVEPLRHLLAKAIDVGPTVAAALGMPQPPVPVEQVRARLPEFRRRWLGYEGELTELNGPREGHPIHGYSIYEATVKLADGNHVLAAFSHPPADGVKVGSWVRVEGYLLKLRDTTYPTTIDRALMLVGRSIQTDYVDWPPVLQLDQQKLDAVDDSSYWPGDLAWRTVEEDQTEALWHLAAYARDTASTRTLTDWRRFGTLNTHEVHQKLVDGELRRGTPLRVFGPLIQRTFLAAPSNPAGIEFWTVALVQVREYGGGVVVPIWVPKRVDIPTRAQLEVRGFYYRWFAYETQQGQRRRVPLFVAADLDVYELRVDATMRTIGLWLGGIAVVFMGLVLWGQRRAARDAVQHSRDMDARRRRRRERAAAPALSRPAAPHPLPPDVP